MQLSSIYFLYADKNDFQFVWEKASALSNHWASIGIMLGLGSNKLDKIQAEGKPPRACLRKVFDCWLKRDYDYKSRGVPTLRMLCNCIKSKSGGADPALADEITKEYSVSPVRTSSEEVQLELSASPVDTSSSKGKMKHFFVMFSTLIYNYTEATPTAEPETTIPLSLQSEDSVVYVKKKSEQYNAPNNLNWMIDNLQQDFITNMRETKKSFHSLDVTEVTDYVQDYTATLLSPRFRKHQTVELMREEFDKIKTMTQLFRILDKYISWFNFEFIVKLVSAFITDDRDLLRKWSTYREKLKDFFKNNNTPAVQIGDAIQFGLSDVPGTKVMVAKVERDEYTLSDLYFFHKAIADALEVPNYKFYFCEIRNGCMELKYSIPDLLYSLLFPLTNQQCDSLAEIGIIKMTCGEYVHEMKKVCHHNYFYSLSFTLQLPDNELKNISHSAIGNFIIFLAFY